MSHVIMTDVMRMNYTKMIMAAAVVFLPLTCAMAQRPKDRHNHKANMEQLESAKIAFFTSEMELTPEEAKVFWPVYDRYAEEKRLSHKGCRESLEALKAACERNGISDVEYKKLLKECTDAREKDADIDNLYLPEFYKILSVKKVAKMYLAEDKFKMKMIRMWKDQHRRDGSQCPPEGDFPEGPDGHKKPMKP